MRILATIRSGSPPMPDSPIDFDEREAALGPPRFTLRTLLLAMTLLGCLFGLMTALGGQWSLVILLFSGLVLAHVLGNSLGTKLRDRAARRVDASAHDPRRPAAPQPPLLPPGRLTQRVRFSRVTPATALAGGVAGAFLGGMVSAGTYPEAGAGAVALGVVSAAVLGAFAGFLTSSFLSVLRQAWREALAHGDAAPTPPGQRRRKDEGGRMKDE